MRVCYTHDEGDSIELDDAIDVDYIQNHFSPFSNKNGWSWIIFYAFLCYISQTLTKPQAI